MGDNLTKKQTSIIHAQLHDHEGIISFLGGDAQCPQQTERIKDTLIN